MPSAHLLAPLAPPFLASGVQGFLPPIYQAKTLPKSCVHHHLQPVTPSSTRPSFQMSSHPSLLLIITITARRPPIRSTTITTVESVLPIAADCHGRVATEKTEGIRRLRSLSGPESKDKSLRALYCSIFNLEPRSSVTAVSLVRPSSPEHPTIRLLLLTATKRPQKRNAVTRHRELLPESLASRCPVQFALMSKRVSWWRSLS